MDDLEGLAPEFRLGAQVHALQILVSSMMLNDFQNLSEKEREIYANRLMLQVDHSVNRATITDFDPEEQTVPIRL